MMIALYSLVDEKGLHILRQGGAPTDYARCSRRVGSTVLLWIFQLQVFFLNCMLTVPKRELMLELSGLFLVFFLFPFSYGDL